MVGGAVPLSRDEIGQICGTVEALGMDAAQLHDALESVALPYGVAVRIHHLVEVIEELGSLEALARLQDMAREWGERSNG